MARELNLDPSSSCQYVKFLSSFKASLVPEKVVVNNLTQTDGDPGGLLPAPYAELPSDPVQPSAQVTTRRQATRIWCLTGVSVSWSWNTEQYQPRAYHFYLFRHMWRKTKATDTDMWTIQIVQDAESLSAHASEQKLKLKPSGVLLQSNSDKLAWQNLQPRSEIMRIMDVVINFLC